MLIVLLLTTYWTPPPYVYTATVADRRHMSVEVASYIHDPSESNRFGTLSVEIGAAAIDWPFALADWRSADGKRRGQVSFVYICDHWNVSAVSVTKPMTVSEIIHGFGKTPRDKAMQLISKLNRLEGLQIAFLEPATPVQGC